MFGCAKSKALVRSPQTCLRQDRLSALEQDGLTEEDAIRAELVHARASLASPEIADGVARFRDGAGRHGTFGQV